MPSSKSRQRLERPHRRFPPIVTKYEFIQVNLELIATHTVMGTQQPLLEIADGSVCQRHYGLRAFPQVPWPRLAARHVLKASLFQSSKALQSVGVYSGTRLYVVFKEAQQSLFSEVRDHRHACAPGGSVRPRFSTATSTSAALRPLSWRLPRRPAWVPPTHVSSTSTSPRSGSRFKLIMARRNLCSIIHAVS